MVKLAELVYIANNAKTDAQKNAVGQELKKLLRGTKACAPKQQLFSNTGVTIQKGRNLRKLGEGQYGAVFYGCLDDACKTKVAIKITSEPSAKMEYRIAEKLKGMGVPRMYHFKTCENKDFLYFEYIRGMTLEDWIRTNPSVSDYKTVISRLIQNLYEIQTKYPKFRHHDLHWNNVLITGNLKPIIIDFGMTTIDGMKNPELANGELKAYGISTKSHPMYDAHYFLNIIQKYTKHASVKNFVKELFPEKYLGVNSPYIKDMRLRLVKHEGLPTFETILKHPFLSEKKTGILSKILRKPVTQTKPKSAPRQTNGGGSAIRRAVEVLKREAEKKKEPIKRAPIRRRDPSVMNQVRNIEKRLQPKPKTPVKRPKVFINANGDLKIDTRKCRLYKKEDLVKMFKLDPKLTKEQMCAFIKNM